MSDLGTALKLSHNFFFFPLSLLLDGLFVDLAAMAPLQARNLSSHILICLSFSGKSLNAVCYGYIVNLSL